MQSFGEKTAFRGIPIVYEDNHILVAEKQPGILSQSDGSGKPDMLTILKEYIKKEHDKPGEVWLGLVHRLDMPTGGLMVFAKTSKAASRLSEDIRLHMMRKTYFAITDGIPEPREALIEDNLAKDRTRNFTEKDDDGKPCTMSYKVLAVKAEKNAKQEKALIEVELITGRSHQIRVQMSVRGWPLNGDAKYGNAASDKCAYERDNLKLWAGRLIFRHPVGDRKQMCFESHPDFYNNFLR